MNANDLIRFQKTLRKKIDRVAEEYNLIEPYYPLYDGLSNIYAYRNSNLKILWILKEGYCSDNDVGGWSITEDLFQDYPYNRKILNKTHQKMAYVSYGILNKCYWRNINYLSNNPEIGEVLHEIAYININKMPANTRTDDNTLWDKYKIWKKILWEQIYAYNPDVIIFGNTFKYFKKHIFKNDEPEWDSDYGVNIQNNARVNVCYQNNTLLIDTNHPQYCDCQGDWANSIIKACKDYFNY